MNQPMPKAKIQEQKSACVLNHTLRVRTRVRAGGETPKNCNPNPTKPRNIEY